MRYINSRFTYLLTYLLTYIELWLLLNTNRKSAFLIQNLPPDSRPEVQIRNGGRFTGQISFRLIGALLCPNWHADALATQTRHHLGRRLQAPY